MKEILIKILSVFLVVVMILNIIFLVSGFVNPFWFWIIIVICAIIAFFILPRLKK